MSDRELQPAQRHIGPPIVIDLAWERGAVMMQTTLGAYVFAEFDLAATDDDAGDRTAPLAAA